jgi:hypothetical protein
LLLHMVVSFRSVWKSCSHFTYECSINILHFFE